MGVCVCAGGPLRIFHACRVAVWTELSFPISGESSGMNYSLPCPLGRRIPQSRGGEGDSLLLPVES